jgi:hypothetical protein
MCFQGSNNQQLSTLDELCGHVETLFKDDTHNYLDNHMANLCLNIKFKLIIFYSLISQKGLCK